MKKYESPEIHFEVIAPEETLLLSYSNEGSAKSFDLGAYLSGNDVNPAAMGFEEDF